MHVVMGALKLHTVYNGVVCRPWIGTFTDGGMPILFFTAGICTGTPAESLRLEMELPNYAAEDMQVVPLELILARYEEVLKTAKAKGPSNSRPCLLCGNRSFACTQCNTVVRG